MGGPLALDGRHLMRGHNQSNTSRRRRWGGRWREEATREERVGGVLSPRAGRRIEEE